MKQTRNAPRFFAKEIDTYTVGKKMFTHEVYHVFLTKSERDAWIAADDYKTRWDMKGRVAVGAAEGRHEYEAGLPGDLVFHFDTMTGQKAVAA